MSGLRQEEAHAGWRSGGCVSSPVVFVVGCTGVGKSEVAVSVASSLRHRLGYAPHVLNCDVSQMFSCPLSISTNQTTREETFDPVDGTPIPHHFLTELDPRTSADFTVASFVAAVERKMEELRAAEGGRAAFVVCGGTTYYAQALLGATELHSSSTQHKDDGSDERKDGDDGEERGEASTADRTAVPKADGGGLELGSLWERVKRVDPASASKYHPHDTRRLQRCLDIFAAEGVPAGALRAQGAEAAPALRFPGRRVCVVWLDADDRAGFLKPRLERRVDSMAARGLLAEIQRFSAEYPSECAMTCARSNNASVNKRARPDDDSTSGDEEGSRGTASSSFNRTVFEAIGVKEVLSRAYSPSAGGEADTHPAFSWPLGEDAAAAALDEVKRNTVRYARQQQRFIRNRIVERYAPLLQPQGVVRVAVDAVISSAVQSSSAEAGSPLAAVCGAVSDVVVAFCSNPLPVPATVLPGVSFLHGTVTTGGRRDDCDENRDGSAADAVDGSTRTCEACDKVISGVSQWAAHLASKGHKGALRHQRVVEEQRLAGREIGPRKKKNR